MGFERESFDKLMKVVWGKKSQMQQAMSRDSKGEPFIIRELEFKGAQTPSQLATALKVSRAGFPRCWLRWKKRV